MQLLKEHTVFAANVAYQVENEVTAKCHFTNERVCHAWL